MLTRANWPRHQLAVGVARTLRTPHRAAAGVDLIVDQLQAAGTVGIAVIAEDGAHLHRDLVASPRVRWKRQPDLLQRAHHHTFTGGLKPRMIGLIDTSEVSTGEPGPAATRLPTVISILPTRPATGAL